MAKPINTRILLRNDELSNWTGSNLVLGKGEVAIATLEGGKLAEVRVGTGTSKWAEALKLNIGTDQVSGLSSLISSLVGDGAKKYQVVANGENGNSWKLQEAALSGGGWSDVTGSTWTVDFSAITTAIDGLTSNVSYLSGQIDATNATLNTVSSDYLKAADKNELTNSIDTKLAKTEFANLSAEIGLDAASASNKVATQNDIAALDGVMHFKGVVSAVPTSTEGYEVGDVVLVAGSSVEGDNGKEFVLVEVNETKKWEQIGDQDHYATKSYVDTRDSNTLTESKAYTDGKITDISGTITATYATKTQLTNTAHDLSTDYNDKFGALTATYATKSELTTLVGTTSAETLVSANAYADSKFAGLSDYYTKDEVNGISSALSTDYVGKIKAVDDKLADYALSANVISLVNETSSTIVGESTDTSADNTIYGAKKYADGAVAALSIDNYIKHGEVVQSDLCGFFILSCGAASLRTDEPPFNA